MGDEADESPDLQAGYDKEVRPWLELAEDLRALSLDKELSVPQIAVMGDQSSGKSSVLEALSGVPFPRGSGLTTRCPVRLVMKKGKPGEKWSAHAATTNAAQQIKVSSPAELAGVIERLTESLTTSASGFSTESIVIRMTSPDAPDLTVVDLPGIVRTATAGQSQAVIQEVNALIEDYLAQQRTIILAVIPSNQDIATVDILERAKRVDAPGERTVGVLTKPDLIGPGNEEEVMQTLRNVRKPLKLGYVMVKNRSQAQVTANMTHPEARVAEKDFFKQHPFFSTLDPKLFGITQLTQKLTYILVERIQQELVPMKLAVEKMLSETRAELKSYQSQTNASTTQERSKLLVSMTQEFVRHLNDCVRGEYRDRLIVVNPRLRLYTRALGVFSEMQSRTNQSAPPFRDPSFIAGLARQMEQLRGRELPGFMSAQSFYMFIQDYIEAWGAPMRMAAAQMRNLALEVVTELFAQIATSYPILREAFQGAASTILEEAEEECTKVLETLLAREKDPFTINDFLQAHINKLRYDRFDTAVERAFGSLQSATADSWSAAKEEVASSLRGWYRHTHGVDSGANAEEMSAIMEAYYTLASKRFVDNVCMALDDQILGKLCSKMQQQCYAFVHDEARLEHFFEEDASMVAKREELIFRRDRLSKANAAMANIQVRGTKTSAVTSLRVTVTLGPAGLGLQLADENGKVVVRGFRTMPDGAPNPGQVAGVLYGDVLDQVQGERLGSFAEAVGRLKALSGVVVMTLIREGGAGGGSGARR